VLLALLLEQMLVRDGDGNLRFDLHELVFHIENDLLQQLLGILGLLHQVVEIGTQQRADAIK
jgi:hypothetical protein